MKIKFGILLLVFILAGSGFAQKKRHDQGFRLTFFGGIGVTNFGGNADAGTGVIGGLYGAFSLIPNLELGFQFNATLTPYNVQFPLEEGVFIEENITQYGAGAYTRFYYFNYKTVRAYIVGGASIYLGNYEQLSEDPIEISFEPAIGFNAGAGIIFDNDFMIEFQYHFVDRQLNGDGEPKNTYDNFQFLVGYQMTLK